MRCRKDHTPPCSVTSTRSLEFEHSDHGGLLDSSLQWNLYATSCNLWLVGAVARFWGELGYHDEVELAYDNEPVLSAGMRVSQTIRAAQGLDTILQPGQMYGKARTALAERSIQTVRAQGKCLMAHLEDKMQVKFPSEHPLRGWSVVHGAWLLNRYHISSSTGTTAFTSLRGRPYKGRVCAFGEEVFALDPLQAKYSTQWRRGHVAYQGQRRHGCSGSFCRRNHPKSRHQKNSRTLGCRTCFFT